MLKDSIRDEPLYKTLISQYLGPGKVIRGGRWFYKSYCPHASIRLNENPDDSLSLITLRVAYTIRNQYE